MIKRSVQWAAGVLGAPLYNTEEEKIFHGVSTDSRTVEPGMLYVPLLGARADGHSFIESVKEKGAAASLWKTDHTPYPEGISLIVVDDPEAAMQQLSKAYLKESDCLRIGITGSNGKTSTKDLTASIFGRKKKTWKTQGNHNNEIGMPLTIFEMDDDTEVLVLEMGMEKPGEIAFLCSLADLDAAIITSIGSAHMENFGSRLEIARAKCEILDGLKENGVFIYNEDSPEIAQILEQKELNPSWKIIGYGKKDLGEEPWVEGASLHFHIPSIDDKDFSVPSINQFQPFNALAALHAAREFGMDLSDMHEGLAHADLTAMRGQVVPFGQARIVDDTYKSNPEAAEAALHTLMKIPGQKHIAVLADMLDLGPEENDLHAHVGTLARELGVDEMYCYGPLSAFTAEAFGPNAKHFDQKEDLTKALEAFRDQDAVLLIKGSRAMAMDEVVRSLQSQDESLSGREGL